jgi:hypothetical protein
MAAAGKARSSWNDTIHGGVTIEGIVTRYLHTVRALIEASEKH